MGLQTVLCKDCRLQQSVCYAGWLIAAVNCLRCYLVYTQQLPALLTLLCWHTANADVAELGDRVMAVGANFVLLGRCVMWQETGALLL